MRERSPAAIEVALQRLVTVYIVTGLLFLLLPGTFLGVWNLVAISNRHALAGLSQSWLQAHGHAQLFGWIGSFIIGIGYYSLSKMGKLKPFSVTRGWTTWLLWTAGVSLRWLANITAWNWRFLLPASAVLQFGGFVIFFLTVRTHRPGSPQARVETWMKLVAASTFAFLLALLMNLAATLLLSFTGSQPEIPRWLDQRYLVLVAWGFPVLAVWGFSARWLPVFLGLRQPSGRGLIAALIASGSGIAAALAGQFTVGSTLLLAGAMLAAMALGVFRRSQRPPKIVGVTPFFPYFVRLAYIWLLVAAVLGVCASLADASGGIWGASRHALTVGFLATTVFAIGQRVLPAFCGMRVLYSKNLMFASLAALQIGCFLRVASEVPAYEAGLRLAWSILPVSAVIELAAVTLFSLNLAVTLILPPPRPAVVMITPAAGPLPVAVPTPEERGR